MPAKRHERLRCNGGFCSAAAKSINVDKGEKQKRLNQSEVRGWRLDEGVILPGAEFSAGVLGPRGRRVGSAMAKFSSTQPTPSFTCKWS